MKTVALSVVAVLAAAGSATAQLPGDAAAAARLQMRIVPVDVTSASPLNLSYQNDSTHNTVADADTNRTRRFEVQYQITEGAGFEGFIASLASMQFSIGASVAGGSLSTPTLSRSVLTSKQAAANSVNPVTNPDTSGNAAGAANINRQGLHGVWRGGLSPATQAGNTLPANGTIVPGGINLITPLTLSQLNQNPINDPAAWYGLYSFEVTVGANGSATDAVVSVGINVAVDAQTQNAWGAYEDADPIPRTSRLFTTAGASFIVQGVVPAPASVALIGLGGLVAGRRRRA